MAFEDEEMQPTPVTCREGGGRCDEKASKEVHTCPFKTEIHEDYEHCWCCENCRDGCNDEI